ncbi:MAG: DUF4112 domain-containing protein, partial [Caulobacterales bacterium]|nr:DUF4112 domain-containing protein [Caulobacterales bacterium]
EVAHSAWKSAETIKKLSDRVVGFGPFGVGLDGILAWIPGAGLIYSGGAAVYLLYLAVQAGVSFTSIAKMAGVLGIDVLMSGVPLPVVPDIADMLWQGHLMAANSLQKDIEARHGIPPSHIERVEKERLKRGRGLGWVSWVLLVVLIAAFWMSDFGETLSLGWWEAFKAATVSFAGFTVALPLTTGAIVLLMFIVNALNRPARRA